MRSLPIEEYFSRLNRLQPYIYDYTEELIRLFEQFLNRPTLSNLTPILNPTDKDICESAYNTLLTARRIHRISNVVIKEMESGLTLFTNGTHTYKEALDKYCQTIFMIRRPVFFNTSDEQDFLVQATEWVLEKQISPIMVSYIIHKELIGIQTDCLDYWNNILKPSNTNCS